MTHTSASVCELLRLRIHDGIRMLPVAAITAAAAANELGFTEQDCDLVRSAVTALCADIVEHHFDDPADADFDLAIGEKHGNLVVWIEDKGLPYPVEGFTLKDDHILGRQHAHASAESIRFENRGIEGNRIELTIRRDPRHTILGESDESVDTTPVEHDASFTLRSMRPEDAPGLARCVYRCYGYSYASDFLYYPEQILAMIERNLLRSYVGLSEEGEVVGHSGLLREHTESPVAESGMGLVDPRYRHHHLLESLKARQSQAVEELDLVGVYVDAVTVHPITQKVNAGLGAHETGILLGQIPGFTHFRGFEEKQDERGSVVVYYRSVGSAPARTVFFPERYRELLESVYEPLALPRDVRKVEDADNTIPETSRIHVEMRGRRGLARIEIECAGIDLRDVAAQYLRELCHKRFDIIHLDLPLNDAGAMSAVDDLVAHGFFWAAVIPELRDGDILRLQYLNNVEIDVESMVLYTDKAKNLLKAIVEDMKESDSQPLT